MSEKQMAATFYIKQNDTAPSIRAILTDSNGRAKPLTNAQSVTFNMSTDAGTNVVSGGACTIIDAAKAIVLYDWQVGDTSTAGSFNAEFEVVYTNGQTETFPNSNYIKVFIKEELA